MMIYILLILFSLVQLRLLYNEHLVLTSYTPQERELQPTGWYQFHTYGTAMVYVAITGFCAMQLYSKRNVAIDWQPVAPFAKETKPSGGGNCGAQYGKNKNAWKLRKIMRKNFNKV